MAEPTDAQREEFWKWCGLDFYENDNRFWARTPSGGAVELLIDLNNLFKYAVPQVKDEDTYASVLFGWILAVIKDKKDPALALFWALWQVIRVSDKERDR